MKFLRKMIMLLLVVPLLPLYTRAATIETDATTVRVGTAYYDLVPGKNYAYFLVKSGDTSLVDADNLLYIGQGTADGAGTLRTAYVPREAVPGTTVLRGEGSQTAQEITWSLNNEGLLTVYGTGEIRDAGSGAPAPWDSIRDSVQTLCIKGPVSQIGAFAFEGCTNLTHILFEGDAPGFDPDCFSGVTATAVYPEGNSTWTTGILQDYGGTITWNTESGGTPGLSIELNETQVTLDAQQTFQLTAAITPEDASGQGVTWTSSDPAVAAVDENGLVTALAKGSAQITAAAAGGSGATAVCQVTVANSVYVAADAAELESAHDYPNNCTDIWVYTLEGASGLEVTFDPQTELEEGLDYLAVYDGAGDLVGTYTGTELAGQTISVQGDTVKLQLQTNDAGTGWGFKVTDVRSVSHDHAFGEWTQTTAPGCDTRGEEVRTCGCGAEERRTVDALGHSFTSYISDGNASCQQDGTKTSRCDRCGQTDTIPDEGTRKAHTFGEWTVAAPSTCQEYGVERRTCENCDAYEERELESYGDHTYQPAVTEPSCGAMGYTTYTCQVCGDSYVSDYTEATGAHVYDGDEDTLCDVCGYDRSCQHEYTTQITAPTCKEQGYTTYTCTLCGDSYADDYVEAAGHSYSEWTQTKAPGCEESGTRSRSCAVCGETETESIPATGHDFSGGACSGCGAKAPGDVNGDGSIDEADAVYLLWHTMFPELYPVEGDADFNGDQAVTAADAVHLLWHTLFPEQYPL